VDLLKRLRWLAMAILLGIWGMSCRQEQPRFRLLSPAESGLQFENNIQPNDTMNVLDYEYFYNGGGVAIGDFNNDGLEDMFLTGNQTTCRLFINKGELKFEDITEQAGLHTAAWCTGANVVDINTDGWLDIYVCAAGYAESERRKNLLYINNGPDAKGVWSGTFTETAAQYGLADTGYSTQSAFFDYDLDGDLDCFLLQHGNRDRDPTAIAPIQNDGSAPNTDRLLQNDGQGHFTDVSRAAGILAEGYGLGVVVFDANADGWPDLHVSNDYIYNDQLYINQRDGTFRDEAAAWLRHTSLFSMGNDAADVNNDGRIDLVTADMLPPDNQRQKLLSGPLHYNRYYMSLERGYLPQLMRNCLHMNTGLGHFSEQGLAWGMAATDWSWSPLLADVDLDGWRDLVMSNGYFKNITDRDFAVYSRQYKSARIVQNEERSIMQKAVEALDGAQLPNVCFQNRQGQGFQDVSEAWGMTTATYSNGAAYADFDLDGDLDWVFNNINQPTQLYENRTRQQAPDRHYMGFKLIGPPANPSGEGATVQVMRGDSLLAVMEQHRTRGYLSAVTALLHIGLGENEKVDSVRVVWSDGRTQILLQPEANQYLTLEYAKAMSRPNQPLKANIDTLKIWHPRVVKEDNYLDFNLQPLIPRQFSQNGPAMAVADVNGDGLPDVYMGGAAGQPKCLFMQQRDGSVRLDSTQFDAVFEDTDAVFFDADNDGDQDLYAVSGGWQHYPGTDYYQDRLYLNQGNGLFARAAAALPTLYASGQCVAVADFDGDGDTDVFRGGGAYPGRYPLPEKSALLRNDGSGHFTDITTTMAPELTRLGILNDAQWADLDGDQRPELVVAGDWLPPTIFHNENGQKLVKMKQHTLENLLGWWSAVATTDLDQDGDTDILMGNIGRNNPWEATEKYPLRCYAKDFDRNGSLDCILFKSSEKGIFPFASRDALFEQLPVLKKSFPDYQSYSKCDLKQLNAILNFDQSYQLTAHYFEHGWLENKPDGFVFHALPFYTQMGTLRTIVPFSASTAGKSQVLLAGNRLDNEVNYGPSDALDAMMLVYDAKKHHWEIEQEYAISGSVNHVMNWNSGFLFAQNRHPIKFWQPTTQ
jgi:enediyne biosynthesis protein E4